MLRAALGERQDTLNNNNYNNLAHKTFGLLGI